MKKEDLLKAVGGADDRFIAEAAPKKINFKNRAPRYPMRLMTAETATIKPSACSRSMMVEMIFSK